MPVPAIAAAAKAHGLSLGRAEHLWNKAKDAARRAKGSTLSGVKKGSDRWWKFVMGVFQKMASSTNRKTQSAGRKVGHGVYAMERRSHKEIIADIDRILEAFRK